jgi:geranylgeranyl diphosphate synthase type II
MELTQKLDYWRGQVDAALAQYLPAEETPPATIHSAMRYAVLGGGKRIRPILAIAACESVGADPQPLLKPFCALELIHTYSLVHDDLPALDNDDLRRGRKTTHVVYGDAMAILTGDALLTEAFAWLSEPLPQTTAERQLRALNVVAGAVDSRGMIGGQVADLEGERRDQTAAGEPDTESRLRELLFIHENKTGRLLTASLCLGGLLSKASDQQMTLLREYGEAMGLAFQIVDDLLDMEESAETLGKTAGKDQQQGKLTYPAVLGVDKAREEVELLLGRALASADMIGGPRNYLGDIARYLCARRS